MIIRQPSFTDYVVSQDTQSPYHLGEKVLSWGNRKVTLVKSDREVVGCYYRATYVSMEWYETTLKVATLVVLFAAVLPGAALLFMKLQYRKEILAQEKKIVDHKMQDLLSSPHNTTKEQVKVLWNSWSQAERSVNFPLVDRYFELNERATDLIDSGLQRVNSLRIWIHSDRLTNEALKKLSRTEPKTSLEVVKFLLSGELAPHIELERLIKLYQFGVNQGAFRLVEAVKMELFSRRPNTELVKDKVEKIIGKIDPFFEYFLNSSRSEEPFVVHQIDEDADDLSDKLTIKTVNAIELPASKLDERLVEKFSKQPQLFKVTLMDVQDSKEIKTLMAKNPHITTLEIKRSTVEWHTLFETLKKRNRLLEVTFTDIDIPANHKLNTVSETDWKRIFFRSCTEDGNDSLAGVKNQLSSRWNVTTDDTVNSFTRKET
ncbi:MAG: hypothetical protein KDK65_05065 [Chlamydiia bacterium]|nr:hypothetical protein [Chlamydiia bacterium]